MKKLILLCVFVLTAVFGMQAQYNYFENADGQHGDIVLGDVDNDGDLDVFIGGEQRIGPNAQKGGLYINDGAGNFTKVDCPALPGWHTAAAFGDIDGDGDLDLLFSGHKNVGIPEANARGLAINDGQGNFTLADPGQYPSLQMLSPSVSFADFNNDGLLDYMVASPDEQRHFDWESATDVTYFGRWSIFYQQADGTFIEDSSQFSNYFRDQVVSTGDFDNDGDIDIFLQGFYPRTDESITPFGLDRGRWITEIFANDGTGHFSILQGTGLPEQGLGSHDWADLDGNGFLDVILTGDGPFGDLDGPWYHRIFSNNNNVFTDVFTSPRARQFSWQGCEVLQDLNNDGDVDVLFGGWCDDIGKQKTFVYNNDDTDNDIQAGDLNENVELSDNYLPGFSEQDFEVGDLNGDFIPDYVYMGFKGNNATVPPFDMLDVNFGGWSPGINDVNTTQFVKLTAPTGLTTTQEISGDKVKVTFSWQAPSNIGNKKSVTYNLALKNTDTGKWLYNPMAFVGGDKDGWRKINKLGNVSLDKTWSLTLPEGNYEWTVQAIDAARFGGSFAPIETMGLGTGVKNIAKFVPNVVSTNGKLTVNHNNGKQLNLKVYAISGVKILDTKFTNEFSTKMKAGAYIVEVSSLNETYKTKVLVK